MWLNCMMRSLLVLMTICCLPVVAAEPVNYLTEIKPLLTSRCIACHGALKQESSLRLDASQLIRQGGDSGIVIVSGKSKESLLIERVTDSPELRMPPEGEGKNCQLQKSIC